MLHKLYLVLKISILVLVRYSASLLQKPHSIDGLFIKVRSRLTDYKYKHSLSCSDLQKVTFTLPRQVSIFWVSPCSMLIIAFSIVSELSWQLDEVAVGDSSDRERFE